MCRFILVFFGPPGVGKGTQAVRLSAELKLPHISTGDLLRDHIKRKTELGKIAENLMNDGQLVPDKIVVGLVSSRLEGKDCQAGVVFDGFPRNVEQDEQLAQALHESNDQVSASFYLAAEDEVVVQRIGGRRTCERCGATSHITFAPTEVEGVCNNCRGKLYQRPDDSPDKVRLRLEAYYAATWHLIEHYRRRGLLQEFDASGRPNAIYKEVLAGALKLQGLNQ